MPWLGDWQLCSKLDCPERPSASPFKDGHHAVQWLQQARQDAFRMRAMRHLLTQDHTASHLARLSDDQVIARIAELLVSGRLHVHVQALRTTFGIPAPPPPSFPIAARQPSAAAPSPKAPPVDDPPTFPPDTDYNAQAATMVAASDSGAAVCPT